MSRYIDLSQTIKDGLITYPGLPAPVICDFFTREDSMRKYDKGETFQISRIEMVANTGTYIDVPFHRFEEGEDLALTKVEKFVDLEGIVVRAVDQNAVDPSYFAGLDLAGKAVLVHTGWSRHWGTEAYLSNNPFLTADAAHYLKTQGVKLVGIDSLNIDDTRTNSRPVHSTLLGENILIVEHLCNLEALPPTGFNFTAVPPKIEKVGSFPVRAFAKLF